MRSHSFYRSFAFACILILVVIRLHVWFVDPFSFPQLLSWALLIASLILAIHGFLLLKLVGRPQGSIENTTILVRQGAYRWIRHPLYTSLLLLAWGAFFKAPDLLGILLAVVASTFLYATAVAEEAENCARFGHPYTTYMQQTKRFIPFVF